MPTAAELLTFRNAGVDRLLYWTGDVVGDKAKVVSMVTGQTGEKPRTDPAPRAFCVSKR